MSLFSLALLAASGVASAIPVALLAHNQRSATGVLSTLVWNGANAANPWAIANGVTASTATWDWNPATGVLSSTGRYEATVHISSNPLGSTILDDKVVDLVINTVAGTTTATSYNCVEGNFVITVGANACLNTSTGPNFINESSALYNVGGNANCVQRTIGGDDSSTGGTRGLSILPAIGACNATGSGAFRLYTIVQNTLGTGGTLILSNGIPLGNANTNYMTFVPVPAAAWLFGGAFSALAWFRRKGVA